MKSIVIFLLILVLGVVVGVFITREVQNRKKNQKITSSFIESKLSDCSDLTTCNLEYVDLVKFEDGTIPFMTKKSFSMIYSANIRAGIDLSKASVKFVGDDVKIELPETEIQSIDVDTDSLRFYDEHFALFNWDKKEDITLAIQLAREDVEKNADLERLKAQAQGQAELVIYKLIEPSVEKGKRIIIQQADAQPLQLLS